MFLHSIISFVSYDFFFTVDCTIILDTVDMHIFNPQLWEEVSLVVNTWFVECLIKHRLLRYFIGPKPTELTLHLLGAPNAPRRKTGVISYTSGGVVSAKYAGNILVPIKSCSQQHSWIACSDIQGTAE